MYSSLYLRQGRGEEEETGYADLEELEQPAVFHPYPPNNNNNHHPDHHPIVDSNPSSIIYNNMKGRNVVSNNNNNNSLQFGCLSTNIGHEVMGSSGRPDFFKGSLMAAIGGAVGGGGGGRESLGSGNFNSWGDSIAAAAASAAMADNNSQQTDTSTDVDTDDKNNHHHHHQQSNRGQFDLLAVVDSDQQMRRTGDQKTLRRLAQNREAARKSRLRKKAYVQQLEHSRVKLNQLEQEVHRARNQGLFASPNGLPLDQAGSLVVGNGGGGAMAFNADYARWLDEQLRMINELRSSLSSQVGESELRLLVDGVISHYDDLFRLKRIASKADVFHILSGMWKTPAERCFMWLGGFRSSELLKILGNQLEPLTDQQLVGICNLQQSSQQAEDALSQGVEALQQSLLETLLPSLGTSGGLGNVADYMGQMAIAMSKLSTLENFIHQADLLRQQTLQQMHRILTTRQAAHALLVINDYTARLRALSSLWLARPRN